MVQGNRNAVDVAMVNLRLRNKGTRVQGAEGSRGRGEKMFLVLQP
jgi:hypothetical protein